MSIVYQHDKRSGITYAYESESYWDKERKQSRSRRHLVGRVDEKTGEIVPTDGRVRKARERAATGDLSKQVLELKKRVEALERQVAALGKARG